MNDATIAQVVDQKQSVLQEAARIVTGARRAAYGTPEDNFARIARLWNAHMINTGRAGDLVPRDVAIFMDLMKTARLAETPDHRDSIVDKIGRDIILAIPKSTC